MAVPLTTEQRSAINSDASQLCIVACAGSGKTTTLTQRIARLVNDKRVDPAKVAAITFTVLAADQLKYELSQALTDKAAPSRMFIGTIHSFCLRLLTEENVLSEGGYAPITEGQRFVLLDKNWRRWEIEKASPDSSRTGVIEKLLATFDIVKMESIPATALAAKHPEVARVYGLYQGFLNENGYLDYADMLVRALHELRTNDTFRKRAIEKCRFLFVDEYQDVDPVQAGIVDTFRASCSVCVVGDDDQAIYQFRGTDHRNLQQFATAATCTTLPLSQNRRCPANVLQVAENAIKRVSERLPKSMSATTPAGLVRTMHLDCLADETGFIVATIQNALKTKEAASYGQFAILMRSVASYGLDYVRALQAAGIPCVSRGARTLFMADEVQKLVAAMAWLAQDTDATAHLALLSRAFPNGLQTDKLKARVDEAGLLRQDDFLKTGHTTEDFDLLRQFLEVRTRYEMRKFGCLLELVYDIIVTLELLHPRQADGVRYNVALMTRIISEYEMIQDDKRFGSLCAFLAAYAEKSYDEAAPVEGMEDAVTLMTVHQAKGLQYDYVFVPMLVEQRFPLVRSEKRWLIDNGLFDAARYQNNLANERRLFYVACTRARKALYLLASRDVGLKKPKKASLFFSETQAVKYHEPVVIPSRPDHVNKDAGHIVTTYSSLEYYLTCPYRYQLIVEMELAFPQAVYFQFGKLIHDVFAWINLAAMSGRPVTPDAARARLEEVFPLYYKNTNMRPYDIRKQKLRGLQAVENYMQHPAGWVQRAHEVERDFLFVDKSALVRGRYDLLVKKTSGRYAIVDYKTGKAHAGLRPDFQMAFYSLAANTQLGLPVDEAILYYVEDNKPQTYSVTADFLKDGATTLRTILDGVLAKDFRPAPKKGLCMQCEARDLCPHRA